GPSQLTVLVTGCRVETIIRRGRLMAQHQSEPEMWSALGFYGTLGDCEVIQSFYQSCIEWCQEIGCQPKQLAISGPKFPKGYRNFTKANDNLAKVKFRGVTAIEIDVMPKQGNTIGVDAGLAIGAKYSPAGDSYASVVGDPSSLPWNDASLLPVS